MQSRSARGHLELSTVRILVIDDYEPWRRFITSTFQKMPAVQVVGEGADGMEAIEKAQELQPDLVLLQDSRVCSESSVSFLHRKQLPRHR